MKSYYDYALKGILSAVCTAPIDRHALVRVNGQICAAVAAEESLSLVSLRTFARLAAISDNALRARVTATDSLPRGALLVFGTADGDAFAYDCDEQRVLGRFAGHGAAIRVMRLFERRGAELCASLDGATVHVWDARLCLGRARIELRGEARDLAVVGELLVLLHADALRVHDAASGALLQIVDVRAEAGPIAALALGERALLVVATPSEECLVFEAKDGQLAEAKAFARLGFERSVQMFGCPRLLIVLTESSWIEFYKLRQKPSTRDPEKLFTPIFRARIPKHFRRIACTDRPFRLFAFSARNAAAEFNVDFRARTLVPALEWAGWGHANPVRWLAVSSDGASLLSGASDSVGYWSCEDNALIKLLPLHRSCGGAFLPGGRFAAVGLLAGRVALLDLAAGKQHLHELGEPLIGLCLFSASPPILALLLGDDNLALARVVRKGEALSVERRTRLREPATRVWAAGDERHIFVALADNSLAMLFADSLREAISFYGHALPVSDAALSTDGYVLATVSGDATLRVWDREFGNCRHLARTAHRGGCTAICLLRDTHLAFTAGADGRIAYWDLDLFLCLKHFDGHGGPVRALAADALGEFFFVGAARALRRFERTAALFGAEEAQRAAAEREAFAAHVDEGGEAAVEEKRLRGFLGAEELMEELEEAEGEARDEQLEREARLEKGEMAASAPRSALMERIAAVPRDELPNLLRFVHSTSLARLLPHILHSLDNGRDVEHCLVLTKHVLAGQRHSLWQSATEATLLRLIADRLIAVCERRRALISSNAAALALFAAELK